MDENTTLQITFAEWQALEAVVYAARALNEGNESWITIQQALDHLDKLRDLPPEELGNE